MALARKARFRVDEQIAAQQVKANVFGLQISRPPASGVLRSRCGSFGPFRVASYMLLALDAEHYKADLDTDAVAMFLRARQCPTAGGPSA